MSNSYLHSSNNHSDPALWSDPDVFRPERYLEQPDAPVFSFGTGTRMCVAVTLANRELFLIFLRLISCFTIEPVEEVDTDPVTGNSDSRDVISRVKPYKARFVPRNRELLEGMVRE